MQAKLPIHLIYLIANVDVADLHLQIADDCVNHGTQEAAPTALAIRGAALGPQWSHPHYTGLLLKH